jgi:Tfp pilus assembly protein PilF
MLKALTPWAVAGLALAGPAAAQLNPDAEGRFSVGITHLREGRVDLALDELKRAAKLDPKNPYIMKGLGQAYVAKHKYGEAIEAFHKALEINPYYIDVKNDLGAALVLSGKREEGRKEFLSAYSEPTNPTPEISARNLGQSYFEEKNYLEALNWFRTSANRNPAYSDSHLGLADTLLAMGRADEAALQLESALKTAPEDANLNLALGQVYLKVGRFTEARQKLESVARKDPTGPAGRQAAQTMKELPR